MTRRIVRTLSTVLLGLVVTLAVGPGFSRALNAQTLDRSKQPPLGKTPELRVPTWTKSKLANGAELVVSEKHDLPLVSFSITFLGGADQFESADRRGVAGLTGAMMSEGTKTRSGDDLSNALQLLGTNVSVGVGSESGAISFVSTTARFADTLGILADMLMNSTFPPEALDFIKYPCTVCGERFYRATGFEPLFSLEDTFASVAR